MLQAVKTDQKKPGICNDGLSYSFECMSGITVELANYYYAFCNTLIK